jgi:glycosyltransferase involved in cell wall biosynthesis
MTGEVDARRARESRSFVSEGGGATRQTVPRSVEAQRLAYPAPAGIRRSPLPTASAGVVITTYNHARFLRQALESVFLQSRLPDAVVVVDDGSTDDPASVVATFPSVRLIRQENRGLAAARNAGLAALQTTHVLFLDADDELAPEALELGLACFDREPESALVYGGHRYVDAEGNELGERFDPPGADPFRNLLRSNFIGMHGTVLYRRDRLVAIGGFDERLRRLEDYDVYLRIAREYPVAGYPDLIASYRLHGGNMSTDHRAMLRTALEVHARYEPPRTDPESRAAWVEGKRRWRRYYGEEMATARYTKRLKGATLMASVPALAALAAAAPGVAVRQVAGGVRRRFAAVMPRRFRERLFTGRTRVPALGRVRFGDLRRVRPVSQSFGFDRGLPVDRYYIEGFLARHASEIAGRVLEIGDDSYTRRFGGQRVTRSDVLHVHGGNPRATLVGDITDPEVLPGSVFDCIILTQTLQLIYDVPTAVRQLHRSLAPGGVVLVTAPGISQIDRGEWGETWFWSFTSAALQRLFADVFGPDRVLVRQHGNVFAATAFLQGLAVEELATRDLDPVDRAYPVIVTLRARKARV